MGCIGIVAYVAASWRLLGLAELLVRASISPFSLASGGAPRAGEAETHEPKINVINKNASGPSFGLRFGHFL